MADVQRSGAGRPADNTTHSFPWRCGGMTFRSRGELERIVEQLANGPTRQHAKAAAELAQEAQAARVISMDEATELKARLYL